MKRILLFACTGIATFFLLPAIYFALTGQVILGLILTCLGLLFLPQLFELTRQYGLFKNLIVRILAFFLIPIIFALAVKLSEGSTKPSQIPTYSPQPLVSQKPIATPTLTPTPTLQETIAPDIPGETDEPGETGILGVEPEFMPTPTPTLVGTQRVRESVVGSCECPYDRDSRGRRCGARSAYSKSGGNQGICYR